MVKTLKCEHITMHLDEFLDGTLNKEQEARYQEHLRECKSCQLLGRQMLRIRDRYRTNIMEPF